MYVYCVTRKQAFGCLCFKVLDCSFVICCICFIHMYDLTNILEIFFICFVYMFWLFILFFKIPAYIVFHCLGGKQGGGIKYCFYSINQNVWTQRLLKNTCKQYFMAAKQWNTCRSIVLRFDGVTLVIKQKLNNLI